MSNYKWNHKFTWFLCVCQSLRLKPEKATRNSSEWLAGDEDATKLIIKCTRAPESKVNVDSDGDNANCNVNVGSTTTKVSCHTKLLSGFEEQPKWVALNTSC